MPEIPFHQPTEDLLNNIETRASMQGSIQGQGWQEFFKNFEELVWPEFQKRGYSRTEALLSWQLNSVLNELSDLTMSFESWAASQLPEDDDEEKEDPDD